MMRSTSITALAIPILASIPVLGLQSPPDFARDIKPILDRSCLKCHGPSQLGGLRLDSRDAALKGGTSGRRALMPHNASVSELIRRVSAVDNAMVMPPVSSGLPRLSAKEIATLRAWIDAGPAWPAASILKEEVHWSLKPLLRTRIPTVRVNHPVTEGKANPIDAFILKGLARKGLKFSVPADRKTLLRRVYYDLTGLPPSAKEIEAFLADTRPGAYERVVDRLLSSPRYGERWARHWLDTIHFADSHGFEHDMPRDNAWPFRDYVIESLNQDKQWPRFIREQLAADYFYPDQPQLTTALGYLGAGTFDLSAYTTAIKNFELIDRDDLVTQTITAFTSTTANCARCHDHKFDPIPQADYYALQAVFAGILKGDRTYDASPQIGAERARLTSLLASANKRDAAVLLSPENRVKVDAWVGRLGERKPWVSTIVMSATSTEGSTLTPMPDGTIVPSGKRPDTDTYVNTLRVPLKTITGIRLDVLASDKMPKGGPGRTDNGNLHLSEIEVERVDVSGAHKRVTLVKATADFNQEGWGVQRAIDGDIKTAWGIYPEVGKSHNAIFTFAEPVTMESGSSLIVTLRQNHGTSHLIGNYRLSATDGVPETISPLPLPVEDVLRVPENERTADQQLALAAHVIREEATTALAKLPPKQKIYAAGTTVDVATVGITTVSEPRLINLLERGDITKPRQEVGPGSLSAIKALPARFTLPNPKDEASRRAALADWIASPDNPLTWRSIVNRVWHYHFGRGICDTPNDFGKMGGVPTHPELLDWLAVWFRDDAKGSLKALHRLIVTSETYRQSSANRPAAAKVDGDNRLLWRQNRQRLDADSVRDFVLAASGKLDLTMGGPAVKHFMSSPGPQNTPTLNYDAFDWNTKGANRRSIYRYVWRGIADPFMEALDFPDLGLLAPARTFSVSSLQALTLYNNQFVLHFGEELAKSIEKDVASPEARVDAAVRRVWMRGPTASERAALVEHERKYGLAAVCRVLFNGNEFLFVD